MHDAAASDRQHQGRIFQDRWPVILALVVLAVPTVLKLAGDTWAEESGAQGPLILVSGGWLLWRQIPAFRRDGVRGSAWKTAVFMALSLVSYVVGAVTDLITFEAGGVYGACVTVLYSEVGGMQIRRNWFPLVYLALAVPPPNWAVMSLTAPLRRFVSFAAADILQAVGLPVSHAGVALYVAGYELLVDNACAGMNSIFGLIAITLFYVYLLHNTSKRYALFLASLTIPIAIIANILRIMILILLTYYAGDEVAQGFLHGAAGMFVFVSTLLLMFGIDALASSSLAKMGRKP